jgi:UDP-glucose 4-epimerase
MMSLDDAVDLVLFAYRHGQGGDTYVQKAPAATIGQLATVLKAIFNSDTEVRIIGTRHGEKKHESLLNREEMARAESVENFYRIGSDTRDLNYSLYFEKGEKKVARTEDYTSANTHQLSDGELKAMLLKLDFIQAELKGDPHTCQMPAA